MKKQKIQTKSKTTKPRSKHHPPEYLAVILLAVLIVEGALFGLTSAGDWQRGADILDMGSAISEVGESITLVAQPMISFVDSVNEFYQLAATQMASLLDLSNSNVTESVAFVYNSVYSFYQEASFQMASLLGIPDVAMASVGN